MKNILLDTHTLIWYLQGNEQLGEINRKLLDDLNNRKYLSIASIWEMALKVNSGKLTLSKPLPYYIPDEIEIIDIKLQHIFKLESLEFYHKDPFDRILIATSIVENMPIMSVDENFPKYPIQLIWNNL